MKDIILDKILIPGLAELYAVDYDNIYFGVSERNICARLAHHMENLMRIYDDENDTNVFREYYADVEYNRMGSGDMKHYENSAHKPIYMVSDLLIQKRAYGRNLLAVEMKRKGNHRHVDADMIRLMSLVSSSTNYIEEVKCVHDTLLGAFIVFSPSDVFVKLFENLNGIGRPTRCLSFKYLHGALYPNRN